MPPKRSKKTASEPEIGTRKTTLKRKTSAIDDKLRVSRQDEAKGVEAKAPSSKRTKKKTETELEDVLMWNSVKGVPQPYNPSIHPEFSSIPTQWQQLITFGIERALTKSVLGAINTALTTDAAAGKFDLSEEHPVGFELLPRFVLKNGSNQVQLTTREHADGHWDPYSVPRL